MRDTRENDVSVNSDQSSSLSKMMADPLFVIQTKWEAFQSYAHGFVKDYAPYYLGGKLRYVTLQYVPRESNKTAALNFHLSKQEKEDIYQSINNPENQAAIDSILKMLKPVMDTVR